MAKIFEEVIAIKFSKLGKESDDSAEIVGKDVLDALEQVALELVGDGIVVEVITE
jgi:hypothetical protein